MNKKRDRLPISEESRCARLDALIDEIFGHLAPDEIETLAAGYEKSEMRMLEVVRIRPQSSILMDLFEDLEFKPALFPKKLMPLLKRHDVFLVTIGFKDAAWTVIHLSPRYSTDWVSF
jgi:hypothetical protein